MGSSAAPYDPNQVRVLAAQQAQATAVTFLNNHIPQLKTEWVKDIQAQAVTTSSQFLKIDHSLLKWDEKGFTFTGKQIGPDLSLNNLLHGRQNAAKKEAEKAEKEAKKEAEEAARQAIATVESRVETFEKDIRLHVDRARTTSRQAQDTAHKAQEDARRADNLLRSATSSAQRAAGQATRANKSLAVLEERVKLLEGVL
ncbi:hypothetical protein ACGF5O_40650 [Streptomyces sp. NPDC048291]|uniref:hypothetical protein n=1 Tax=Streptomyces sp. NPDC048291 TaxID=3365530 RepID=UPI0037192A12